MGNYSDYAVKKEQLRVAAWNAYMNQQREIKHQEEVIEKLKSFNREKSIKRAESREKMLDKIEVCLLYTSRYFSSAAQNKAL